MKNLFVPFELAKQLKEKGFDEPTLAHYIVDLTNPEGEHSLILNALFSKKDKRFNDILSAPLYQQVINWLRQEPRFIQILEMPEQFTDTEPMYCIKERGHIMSDKFTLNEAIETALNLIKK